MSELLFGDVVVRYGKGQHAVTAVDHVSLRVPAGSVVGLVGESGSGKSSLVRAAFGLAPLSSGLVTLGGQDVAQLRRRGRTPMQMIFQDPYASLDPRMSIGRSIAEAIPRAAGLRGAALRAEVARLLELVNVDAGRARLRPDRLSGGQRQRVAIARALAGRPSVIVADEITSALDVSVQGAVLNLVRELQASLGLTVLFISHDLAVVRYVSDHVAVMYNGRLVESGPGADVLDGPRHPYTQQLVGVAAGGTVNVAALTVEPPDPHRLPPGCAFHPRCPVGPLHLTSRQICRTVDPGTVPADGRHAAACHFAPAAGADALPGRSG